MGKPAEEPVLQEQLCHPLGRAAGFSALQKPVPAALQVRGKCFQSVGTGLFALLTFCAAEQLPECLPPGYRFVYLHQRMFPKYLAGLGWCCSQLCVGSLSRCVRLAGF